MRSVIVLLDNKVKLTKTEIDLPIRKQLNIKLFGDLHFCDSFDGRKLDLIDQVIYDNKTDYVCIPGDIIDSTNFIKNNSPKVDTLLSWLEKIGENNVVFIALGSHDYSYLSSYGWREDYDKIFWSEVNFITGVNVLENDIKYEDDNVIVKGIDPGYQYYYNQSHQEDCQILLDSLREQRKQLINLSEDKAKIMLSHSPICITNPEVLKLLQEFDLIFSGHMHNGMMVPILDEIINNNRGIIAPNKSLWPDNARGLKKINVDGEELYLLITSGVTKIQECAPSILQPFNGVFPMGIDEIIINPQQGKTRKLRRGYKYI